MKKLFTLLAIALFSFSVVNAQEEPKKEKPATERKCCKKEKKKSCDASSEKKSCEKDKKSCDK